jgi:hypothetical protein
MTANGSPCKKITLILFGLISISTFAQQNLYPRNFTRTIGISKVIVKRDCPVCKPSEKDLHIQTFHFDKNGFNIEENGIDKGKKSGMQKYYWNSDGTIKSYQNYNSFSVTMDDPDDMKTWGQVWNDTVLTNELRYKYDDSLLSKIMWIDGQSNKLTLEVVFEYNSEGKVIKEQIVDYPDGGISIGFKPNSTEIIDLPDANNKIVNYKEFIYESDTVYITYYKKGIKSGTGKKVVNPNGQLQFEVTYDLNGKVIYQINNEYNKQGKLITQSIKDTGYDGFGNGYDFAGGDLIKYEYDKDGNRISKSTYYEGKIWTIEKYEYIK